MFDCEPITTDRVSSLSTNQPPRQPRAHLYSFAIGGRLRLLLILTLMPTLCVVRLSRKGCHHRLLPLRCATLLVLLLHCAIFLTRLLHRITLLSCKGCYIRISMTLLCLTCALRSSREQTAFLHVSSLKRPSSEKTIAASPFTLLPSSNDHEIECATTACSDKVRGTEHNCSNRTPRCANVFQRRIPSSS